MVSFLPLEVTTVVIHFILRESVQKSLSVVTLFSSVLVCQSRILSKFSIVNIIMAAFVGLHVYYVTGSYEHEYIKLVLHQAP